MTDNAKCAGVGCPIREQCRRFDRWGDGYEVITPKASWLGFNRRAGIITFMTARPVGEEARFICRDHQPLPVEPHGGASEEGDQC